MQVTISKDHSVTAKAQTERQQEHNANTMEITIPDELKEFDGYLEFELPEGDKYLTDALDTSSGVIYFNIPSALLVDKGKITCQLVARKGDVIWKSNIWRMTVEGSINAVETLPVREPDWLDKINTAVREAQEAAKEALVAAEAALNAVGQIGPSGPPGSTVNKIYATTGTGAAFEITDPDLGDSYVPGKCFTMIAHINSTTTSATLSINGLPAKRLTRFTAYTNVATTTWISSTFLLANTPVNVMYDGAGAGTFVLLDLPKPDWRDLQSIVYHNTTGQSTAGIMTQKAITDALDALSSRLASLEQKTI